MDEDKNFKHKEIFIYLIKAHTAKEIIYNVSSTGSIKYSQDNIKLNKKCLIIIDEVQDLVP